jgi:predicted nucleotidyltransferase
VDDLRRALGAFIAAHSAGIAAVYLFGSEARGTARAGSDLDLGVLFDEPPRRALMGPLATLQAALEQALQRKVDLIDLHHAPVDLVHRVMRDGHLVFEGDRARRVAFEVARRNEYFDLLPFLERYRRVAHSGRA